MSDAHQLGPLLSLARSGNREAVAQLVEKLRPWIRQQAAIRLERSAHGSFDASDVAQSVCLKMYTRFVQFRGGTVPQLLAWVGRITRNAVATKMRRMPGSVLAGSSVLSRLPDKRSPTDRQSDTAAQAVDLAVALDRLPEAYRIVIEQRFFHQLSFDQISKITGRTPGALRVACLRAIERLRSEFRHD